MKKNPVHAVDPVKKPKNPAAVALGRLGGQVTGPCKSRGTLKARRAARARWDAYEAEMTAKIEAAHAAKFPLETENLRTVRAFYEIRGLHRRGRIGDSALVNAHETAAKAASNRPSGDA